MRRLVVLAAAAVLALPLSAHAAAQAPLLTTSEGTQRGALAWTTTYSGNGRDCAALHSDGPGLYPEAVLHTGGPMSWRIADRRRPATVTVTMRRTGPGSFVILPLETVPVRLSPVRDGRRTVAWLAVSGEVGYGDLHLNLYVKWPRGKCGADEGLHRYRVASLPLPR